MSSQTHRIELQARDGTKQAFDSIKRSATEDARALEQMGKTGSRALQDVEKSANNTARGMRDLQIGLAALGTGFALASRAAADQTRQIDAINRLYGESADEILKLSEAIQDNTNFSNDAARQAAITGSTLAANYELSAEQIGVLIERSADLAQIHGVDLADAMTRVSGAIRGEGEAAELLGLNMSDAAVAAEAAARGLTGWTTTMTEAEKAAFRYQLVLEQTTATQGTAAEAADTTAGRVRQIAHDVQDAAQQFAAWTGPVGESVAVLSDYALQIGLATAGVAKLATGLQALAAAGRLSTLALGPVGLVLAAGAAALALYKLTQGQDEYAESAAKSRQATQDLAAALNDLNAAGSPLGEVGMGYRDTLNAAIQQLGDLATAEDALAAARKRREEAEGMPGDTERERAMRQAAIDETIRQIVATENVIKALRQAPDALQAVGDVLAYTGTGAELAQKALADAFAQFEKDDDAVALIATLDKLNDNLGLFDQQANRAASSADRLAAAAERSARKWQEYDEAVRAARQADIDKAAANKALLESMSVQANAEADQLDRNQQKWNEYDAAQRAANDSRVQSTQAAQEYLDALAAERAELEANAVAGDSFASATAGVGDAQTDLTDALAAGTDALRETESAMERLARGSTSAGVALRAFKDIQDGIIADQGPFNRQLSEYNQQLDLLQNAEDLLNQRKAEGIALTAEQEDFLNRVDAAQARLEGGTEDATLALGYQALAYAENVRLGDQLNDTLSGTNGAVTNLSSSVDRLTAALIALSLIDATPTVAVSGLAEANAELGVVLARMAALDGSVASATVNVGANIDPRLSGVAGLFGGGGMVGAAQGRMVRVNEGGREMATLPTGDDVWLPNGTMVWPHAASTMGNRGKGAIPFTNYGNITIVANNPVEFGAHLRDYGLAGR
jgi:hypothetical protein